MQKQRQPAKKSLNIINFVRGCEPRVEMDLVLPVQKHMESMKQYGLKGTFLYQYDALLREDMVLPAMENRDCFEFGGWLEIVQPMVEAAGIPWRGRFPWDYHPHVGFTVGYTYEQRKALIDVYMEKFRQVFGCYPKVMGSWMIDGRSLRYLEKYGIEAVCICRDQCGTDGYNLWGGYYNHGFYPSENNMLCPAQSEETQVNIPVFRMLGSDPLYQYDAGLSESFEPTDWQPVMTLEPVCGQGGGDPQWVKWYLEENFKHDDLGFQYTQAGQENSFAWDEVGTPMQKQYAMFADYREQGLMDVETLGETGRWFRQTYAVSPACTMAFQNDWRHNKEQTFWYYNRFYRVNFHMQDDKLWIRDWQCFDDRYTERYYHDVETTTSCFYDNLPIIDGFCFSGNSVRCGGYLVDEAGDTLSINPGSVQPSYDEETGVFTLLCQDNNGQSLKIVCNEQGMTIQAEKSFAIKIRIGKMRDTEITDIAENAVTFVHQQYLYQLHCLNGFARQIDQGIALYPQEQYLQIACKGIGKK